MHKKSRYDLFLFIIILTSISIQLLFINLADKSKTNHKSYYIEANTGIDHALSSNTKSSLWQKSLSNQKSNHNILIELFNESTTNKNIGNFTKNTPKTFDGKIFNIEPKILIKSNLKTKNKTTQLSKNKPSLLLSFAPINKNKIKKESLFYTINDYFNIDKSSTTYIDITTEPNQYKTKTNSNVFNKNHITQKKDTIPLKIKQFSSIDHKPKSLKEITNKCII